MELLKPNGTFTERIFELIAPMADVALSGERDREMFKNQAFMEFEEIRKEIQRLKSEEEFLVPKLPLRKTRTKKRTMKSQQSMTNSHELSDKTSVVEPSRDLSVTNDRTSRALRRERSKRPSIAIRSPPASSRPSKVRKLNKLQKQAPDSISLEDINQDKKLDEDLLSNKATENEGGHEDDKTGNQQCNNVFENQGNGIEGSKEKMEDIQSNKVKETQIINKIKIQVSDMQKAQDNKNDCVQNNKEVANKDEDNQSNKTEDDHCDMSQNIIQFNEELLFTSTPRPSCLVGKLRHISDQTTIAPKDQITSNRLRKTKETHQIDVVDGIVKKTIDMKDGLSTKAITKVVSDVKSQKKNAKNVDKENLGYKTPEPIVTPNKKLICSPILSGSVKKRVEAIERAGGKLIEGSPRIRAVKTINTKLELEKKYENPMRMTRNASKALSHALNNHGSVTKLSYKALQEKTNTMKSQDERENNAYKKKEELIKAAVEEKQRRREEKGKKVIAQREAEEKEKMELALKLQKEKEEKFKKLQKERDEKIKEENMKKKLLAAQKAAEMEERRKEDEAARIARLKEIEEEERRKVALKIRTETEKIRLKKLEEQRIQQAEKEREKEKLKVAASKQDGKKKETKDPEDYGADDMNAEDSTDDEDKPKREVPIWAEKKNRKLALIKQSYIPDSLIHKWFHKKNDKKPNLATLFTGRIHTRPRTSSVLWDSRVCFDNSTMQFS